MAKDKFNGFEVDNGEGLEFVDSLRKSNIGPSKSTGFDETHEVKVNEGDDEDIDNILDQIKKSALDNSEVVEEIIEEEVKPTKKQKEIKKEEVIESTEEVEKSTEGGEENPETDQINLLWDAFVEYNGIESDDDRPENVEKFFDKINKVVEEKSVPKYGNELIKEMDEYVKNGGDISDYFQAQQSIVDFEDIDLDDVDNQKKVITEFLSRKGFNNQQIAKKIERYQDADMLEDESKDAHDFLKDIMKQEKEALLERQENLHTEQVKAQQQFYSNVVNEIESVSDIRGIKIPEKDKRELMQYIFKVESDGTTRYQKDYNKSVRNLIESAYFTMKGDALINNAKKSGESDAVKKFKSSLSSKQINKSSGRQDFKEDDLFSMLSSQLRN